MEDSRQGKKGGQKSFAYGGSGPQRIQVVNVFLKNLFFASLCSLICLQAVYQLSGPEY